MKASTYYKAISFGIFLSLSGLGTTSVAQDLLKQGEKWYHKRAVRADSFIAQTKYINKAIQSFEDAQKSSPSVKVAEFLLKSYYFKGMFLELNDDKRKYIYEKGREVGEKMIERYPRSAAIKFWYGANIGRWAELHGFIASATSGVAKKLRSLCKDIIDLNPKYQGGGGYRILAQVHFYAPKIPIIMNWPSDEKALKLIKKAMKIAPRHPSNRLFYAKVLLDFKRKEKAKKQLDYLIGFKPRATFLAEDRFVKHRARILLSKHFSSK